VPFLTRPHRLEITRGHAKSSRRFFFLISKDPPVKNGRPWRRRWVKQLPLTTPPPDTAVSPHVRNGASQPANFGPTRTWREALPGAGISIAKNPNQQSPDDLAFLRRSSKHIPMVNQIRSQRRWGSGMSRPHPAAQARSNRSSFAKAAEFPFLPLGGVPLNPRPMRPKLLSISEVCSDAGTLRSGREIEIVKKKDGWKMI